MKRILTTLALAATSLLSGPAHATIATFGFEGVAPTNGVNLTSLSQSNSGLTITITRPGSSSIDPGTTFAIEDLSGLVPPSFGARTLTPTLDPIDKPLLVNFSQPVTAFSFQAGDFGGDEDLISLSIFSGPNGTGTLLGSTSMIYPATSALFLGNFVTLSLSGTGILSAEMVGGSSLSPNSVSYDNLSATFGVVAVPEPASVVLFGTALVSFGLLRQRRRRLLSRG